MLKNLFKDTLQQIFEAEIEEHLGYKKHSIEGNNTGNSRNGYNKKTIQTKFGKSEIEVPRDRNGEFEPRIIGKYENYPSENKILSRMLRKWLLNRFVILSIHSLPFNAFFKAAANIKTSILHLRKKVRPEESQGYIFMSITNNVGHNNSLKDTPYRNNLNEILATYLEWQRTGSLDVVIKNNHNPQENLECPQQCWLLPPEELNIERFDAFFYSPELKNIYSLFDKAKKIRK
ncbi:MAG: hypothetical protein STSR0004_18610 [Peptococcaceae bacterium]